MQPRSEAEWSSGEIVHLNVGGQRFSTSRQTLTRVADSFFTSLISGRIPTVKDDTGAVFIDRDPLLFRVILNYLRTKQVDLSGASVAAVKHEAQYYGLSPLVKRLTLCEELDQCGCGDVHFHGYLAPPPPPLPDGWSASRSANDSGAAPSSHSRNLSEPAALPSRALPSQDAKFHVPVVLPEADVAACASGRHSRGSSADYMKVLSQLTSPGACTPPPRPLGLCGHAKKGSADLTRQIKADLSALLRQQARRLETPVEPLRVRSIRGHHNWIAVAYAHFVCCYRMKDSLGWQLAHVSARLDSVVRHVALHTKFGAQSSDKMLAVALANCTIHLYRLDGAAEAAAAAPQAAEPAAAAAPDEKMGVFSLGVPVDRLFFIGGQLVALSQLGKIGIWHSMTHNWQVQDVEAISSYDTAGSFLLLGCANGSIYYIDMQKFPLRMKDNDLLVTELYRDPCADVITAISVYLTPKTNLCGNWIEIAYGTMGGAVRVIVQHPETVGHGPQLFQTFSVHRAPITRVALTTAHLISVCSEYSHVRSWAVTRFRGMISTQPGSQPLASFKVLTLESTDLAALDDSADAGPFGEQDGEQLFVQKVVPDTNQVFVRLASTGQRLCSIKSVDESAVSNFLVHECDGSSRMGSRPRRYLFTGHANGSIQMWDLTTALDRHSARKSAGGAAAEGGAATAAGGPTADELLQLIDECEICCNSFSSTPCSTPASSVTHLPSLLLQHVDK